MPSPSSDISCLLVHRGFNYLLTLEQYGKYFFPLVLSLVGPMYAQSFKCSGYRTSYTILTNLCLCNFSNWHLIDYQ